jgi:hypothetical protein
MNSEDGHHKNKNTLKISLDQEKTEVLADQHLPIINMDSPWNENYESIHQRVKLEFRLSPVIFAAVFGLILVLFFVIQLIVDGLENEAGFSIFSEIRFSGKFTSFMMGNGYLIAKKLEVYRLITALFVHSNLTHLLYNFTIIVIAVVLLGQIVDNWKLALIFLLSGEVIRNYGKLVFYVAAFKLLLAGGSVNWDVWICRGPFWIPCQALERFCFDKINSRPHRCFSYHCVKIKHNKFQLSLH